MAEDGERSSDQEGTVGSDQDGAPPASAEPTGASPQERSAEARGDSVADAAAAESSAASAGSARAESASASGGMSKLWWALPILMLVEFYMYGHNGRLEICVGKEGDTDFSLVGQERTDENRWKFPRCETRMNLGLRSQRELKVEEGLKVACRGATIFRNQGEAKACIAGDDGWQHQIKGSFVAPWEPAYYRHLFWFLQ